MKVKEHNNGNNTFFPFVKDKKILKSTVYTSTLHYICHVCYIDLLRLYSFAKITLLINFVDRLQRLHGSFKSNESSSEGQKDDQPRGENAIGFGVRLALHR